MLLLTEKNAFTHREECFYSQRRMLLLTEKNAFTHREECVYSQRRMLLLTEKNAFTHREECIYSQRRMRFVLHLASDLYPVLCSEVFCDGIVFAINYNRG